MVWQIRGIRIGGVVNSTAVAVVLGAAELGWLGQHEEHHRLGFHFRGRAVRGCISWRRYVDDVLVASRVFCDSCIFVFLCVRATQYHSRWCREEVRQSTRGLMWNCASLGSTLRSTKNTNRSWVQNLGPQQKSTFLPWTGVLKGGLGSIRGVVLGRLARSKMLGLPEQFGVARLLEYVVELVFLGYPFSVIRGLVHSLPCSRVTQIGRKTVRT